MFGKCASGAILSFIIILTTGNICYATQPLTRQDRLLSLKTIGFVVSRLPIGHVGYWKNPNSENSGTVVVVDEYDRKVPTGNKPKKKKAGFAYDNVVGGRVWFPLNPRQKTRDEFCRKYQVEVAGYPTDTHLACHTHRNTWIVDKKWILNSFEQDTNKRGCQKLFLDIKVRGRITMDGLFCKTSETQWQAHLQ